MFSLKRTRARIGRAWRLISRRRWSCSRCTSAVHGIAVASKARSAGLISGIVGDRRGAHWLAHAAGQRPGGRVDGSGIPVHP